MASTSELLNQALDLDEAERAKLVQGLLQSLSSPDSAADDDLQELLEDRLSRVESGEGVLTDGDEAMDELLAGHKRRIQEHP